MAPTNPLLNLTPAEFEKYVAGILRKERLPLNDLSISHLKQVDGSDGEYEMDLVATFSLFGGAIVRFLIECKRYCRAIERDIVMVLNQKLTSTGSHKGMIFSTSQFQEGAIRFAKAHGIALVYVEWGKKRVSVTNQEALDHSRSEEDVLLDSYTSSLLTNLDDPPFPYLARPDVYPGENLKAYLGLSEVLD